MVKFFTKCKDCTHRYPACHDTCPHGYLEEKARLEEVKKLKHLDDEYHACAKELSLERKKIWLNKRKY